MVYGAAHNSNQSSIIYRGSQSFVVLKVNLVLACPADVHQVETDVFGMESGAGRPG